MKNTKLINNKDILDSSLTKSINKQYFNKYFYRSTKNNNINLESDLVFYNTFNKNSHNLGECKNYYLTINNSFLFKKYQFEIIEKLNKPETFIFKENYFTNFFKNKIKSLILIKPTRGGFIGLYLGIIGFIPKQQILVFYNYFFHKQINNLTEKITLKNKVNFFKLLFNKTNKYLINIPFLNIRLIFKTPIRINNFSKNKNINFTRSKHLKFLFLFFEKENYIK